MFNVSIIDNRLQRVADFGKSQSWAMDRASMPPSNNGIPFKRMNRSGNPLLTLFSIFWKKEFLGRAFFISLPSVFSVDIAYGKK